MSFVIEPSMMVGPDELLREAAEKLDLLTHLDDLERDGYTVVPPEKVASAEFLEDLRDAVLALHARWSADEVRGPLLDRLATAGAGRVMQASLFEDPIFEQAIMNPVAQTLARFMAGHACRISAFDAVVKPAGGPKLPLHCDTEMTEPYPSVPQACNITYALTDYSAEHGSTTFVPGSHRLQRQPRGTEVDGVFTSSPFSGALQIPTPVPVTCRAGSIVAWSGLTWHGAIPRVIDGDRVSVIMYFCRWYLQQQEVFRDAPIEALERNAPRFKQLLEVVPGWEMKNPLADRSTAVAARTVYPILDVARP
jgi:ectoine hydroxylase-related dioxygenase (phytanoyl-CoA dioxygenase family)